MCIFYFVIHITATYCNEHTKIALIRGRHGPHQFLMKAIPAINDIAGKFVSVEILYVGATMKHCFIFIRVSIYHYIQICS